MVHRDYLTKGRGTSGSNERSNTATPPNTVTSCVPQVQTELLQLDVRTRQFCGRDPDTKNVANIFGLETTDKLVRTLWGDPDDPLWQSR